MNKTDLAFLVVYMVLAIVLIAAARFAIWPWPTQASQTETVCYRVVGSGKDSTMEKEINQLAQYGCRVVAMAGGGYGTEHMTILECPPDTPSLH